MGGAKKTSPAQAQKRQADEAAKKDSTKSKKGKKDAKSDEKSAKSKIRVTLTDEQASKILKGSKAITAQELSRQTGVKISAANSYLIKSIEKGTIKKIAGHSGHYIYQPLSA